MLFFAKERDTVRTLKLMRVLGLIVSVSVCAPLPGNAEDTGSDGAYGEVVKQLSDETSKALSTELGQQIFYILSFDVDGKPVVGVPSTTKAQIFDTQEEAFAKKEKVQLKNFSAFPGVRSSASPDMECREVTYFVLGKEKTKIVCVQIAE